MTEAALHQVISYGEQRECAERELKMRRRVYERRVSEGKMTQRFADSEIAAMAAIVMTLQRLEQAERLL